MAAQLERSNKLTLDNNPSSDWNKIGTIKKPPFRRSNPSFDQCSIFLVSNPAGKTPPQESDPPPGLLFTRARLGVSTVQYTVYGRTHRMSYGSQVCPYPYRMVISGNVSVSPAVYHVSKCILDVQTPLTTVTYNASTTRNNNHVNLGYGY
jgi:hypothetical protein